MTSLFGLRWWMQDVCCFVGEKKEDGQTVSIINYLIREFELLQGRFISGDPAEHEADKAWQREN